jgi:hypothetical protein
MPHIGRYQDLCELSGGILQNQIIGAGAREVFYSLARLASTDRHLGL